MLFVEFAFLPFFALVFLVHWALRHDDGRKVWLLFASYVFYAGWDWRFLGLIIASTLVDYVAGIQIAKRRRPRSWLTVSLVVNLGILGFFKYFNFFLGSAVGLIEALGFQANVEALEILLPVGISFYTFQTLSYSLDIYYERLEPTRNLLDLATFVAFFPQLVAGPIVRAREFLPQLSVSRALASVAFRPALTLFLVGFIKKTCISDHLGPYVDAYFANPVDYAAISCWVASIGFAVQVYCDFSGYSDMAIACAALLGYQLPRNFDFPYFSRNVTEVWRRWHMTLSTFMRDYLYFPLGGNRGGVWRVNRNVMLTMLIGGLWHGAGWNFVLWGGLNGLGLIAHRTWSSSTRGGAGLGKIVGWVSVPMTFLFFSGTLAVFRSRTLADVGVNLKALLLIDTPGGAAEAAGSVFPPVFLVLFVGAAVCHYVAYRGYVTPWLRALPDWAFTCVYALLWALTLPWVKTEYTPFIYFQF